jgi:endonuclease/exonuclease/phosphatase family metal-dependent hydrolase
VIGSNYLLSTVGLKHIFNKEFVTKDTFTVLSYNVKSLAGHYSAPYSFERIDQQTLDLKSWLLGHEAEIQCYQEFINYGNREDFNLVKMFEDKGYYTYFSYDSSRQFRSVVVGTLITSKFPIVASGDVVASENGFNRITFADVKMDMDTVRIVNVHLESMGLKKHHPLEQSGFKSKKESAELIVQKLKEGVFERSRQIKILATFIGESPYPVICAGDFNDMPYSYSYQYMKKRMKNTFEQVGTGFGFTYNGNTLRVLRIDNQFYSRGVQPIRFETLDHIEYTDHFPLEGLYRLSP